MAVPASRGLLDGIHGGLGAAHDGGRRLESLPALNKPAGVGSKKCVGCHESFRGFGVTCAACRKQTRPAAGASDARARTRDFVAPLPVGAPPFEGVVAELFVDPSQTRKIRVGVHDARKINLEMLTNGFELIRDVPTALSRADFAAADDSSRVECDYYDEVCEAVRNRLGASRVVCYSHKVRLSPEVDYAAGASGYSHMIHADFSESLARSTVFKVAAEKKVAEGARYLLVNVWRNVSDDRPIINNHLACCDTTSVTPSEILGGGGSPTLDSQPHHRWCYFPRMARDEALLFLHWDSAAPAHRPCFHTAFDDPTAPPSAPHRESIEARLLVIYNDPPTGGDPPPLPCDAPPPPPCDAPPPPPCDAPPTPPCDAPPTPSMPTPTPTSTPMAAA